MRQSRFYEQKAEAMDNGLAEPDRTAWNTHTPRCAQIDFNEPAGEGPAEITAKRPRSGHPVKG